MEYPKEEEKTCDCEERYNCCCCGFVGDDEDDYGCGCPGCWSCNACEECKNEE